MNDPNDSIIFLLIIIIPFVLFFGIIFGINAALKKRKAKKRQVILDSLPQGEIQFYANIRVSSDEAHKQVFKFKSYEYSALLYIHKDKIHIVGYNGHKLEYNLRTCYINWVGIALQNGLLDWFSIGDANQGVNYINIDTGLFVFQLGNKMTTNQLYSYLRQEQQIVSQRPPDIQ